MRRKRRQETVAINADDKMKYDLTAFEVKPGQKVIVNFKNVGTTPKFSMGHNFVLLDHSVNAGNVQTFLDKASTRRRTITFRRMRRKCWRTRNCWVPVKARR